MVKSRVRELLRLLQTHPAIHGTEVPRHQRESLREAEGDGLIYYSPETGWYVTPKGEQVLLGIN